MVMLTDLATACRKSGLRVVETRGWKTRGAPLTSVDGLILHHTATSSAARGNMPTLNMLTYGRAGLPGPLSHLGLGRDGSVYVIAAGRANHAGATRLAAQGNSRTIGLEVEAPGTRPIEGDQYKAMLDLCRALKAHYSIPLARIESHAEIAVPAGRKIDIRNDMRVVRSAIASGKTGPGSSVAAPGRYLAVNGSLNRATVKRLQEFLGSTGLFNFARHGGYDGVLGPYTISALQVWIARQGFPLGRADGIWGAKSARAAERWLGLPPEAIAGWYPGLVRGLQRRLNIWTATRA